MAGAITGDVERTEEEKEGGSASIPREVPSYFSAVVAPMLQRDSADSINILISDSFDSIQIFVYSVRL